MIENCLNHGAKAMNIPAVKLVKNKIMSGPANLSTKPASFVIKTNSQHVKLLINCKL